MNDLAGRDPRTMHIGRSFGGPAHLEQGCPCEKALCGLVAVPSEDCDQHYWTAGKTIRSSHWPEDCPYEQVRAEIEEEIEDLITRHCLDVFRSINGPRRIAELLAGSGVVWRDQTARMRRRQS